MSLLQERMSDPVHLGPLAAATAVGAVGNPACGDVLTIHLRIVDGVVQEATFDSMGSAYQLATASVLIDCILGKSMDHARRRTPACVLDKLPDLPDNKRYLARLGLDALHRALDDAEARLAGRTPAGQERPCMDAAEARAFVQDLLANGREWGTREVEAMVQAEGKRLPQEPVRFLAAMRSEGLITGAMDLQHRSWRWRAA